MTIEDIQSRFCKKEIAQILPILQESNTRKSINLTGLAGSSYALLVAQLSKEIDQNQVFILSSKERAAFFYNDIEKLLNDRDIALPNKRVHYLPSSYKRAHTANELDNSNVKLRAEIINKFSNHPDGSHIVVTYPEALAEKVVTTKFVQENSFSIQKDSDIPTEIFLNFLYEFEYKQEDFVFEPGQFAWRGSIFDIFSYSEEYPYRIELDGDRVESIRFFNPETQLSIREEEIVHIMPQIASHNIEEQRIPFLDFVPESTLLWLDNPKDISAQIGHLYKTVKDEFAELDDTPKPFEDETKIIKDADLLFIKRSDFEQEIMNHKRCFVNAHDDETADLSLDFGMKPQNNFGRSFDYLFLEWIDNMEKGIKSIFLAESQSQLDRLFKIMLDMLDKYNRHNDTQYKIEPLYYPIRYLLHEGFRDETRKIAIYTDHQFLEKFERIVIRDRYKKSEAFTLKEIYDLQPGDYVVHINFGIGVYQGLEKTEIGGKEQEVIKLTYKDGDILYVSIHSLHKISKYVGKDGTPPKVPRLRIGMSSVRNLICVFVEVMMISPCDEVGRKSIMGEDVF